MSKANHWQNQISASGNNLTANQFYGSNITVCSNVYPNTFLWSTGDTTQTISVNAPGSYTCTVTSNVGCVFTTSYNYNGSLTPTFDCNQMDMFEANNDLSIVSFQSSYVNNNTFPELIDSLSFWDIFDASGQMHQLKSKFLLKIVKCVVIQLNSK